MRKGYYKTDFLFKKQYAKVSREEEKLSLCIIIIDLKKSYDRILR